MALSTPALARRTAQRAVSRQCAGIEGAGRAAHTQLLRRRESPKAHGATRASYEYIWGPQLHGRGPRPEGKMYAVLSASWRTNTAVRTSRPPRGNTLVQTSRHSITRARAQATTRASGLAIEVELRAIRVDLAADPEYAVVPEAETLASPTRRCCLCHSISSSVVIPAVVCVAVVSAHAWDAAPSTIARYRP